MKAKSNRRKKITREMVSKKCRCAFSWKPKSRNRQDYFTLIEDYL